MKPRLRITYVMSTLPPLIGGLQTAGLRMAQQLQGQGHEVQLVGRFAHTRQPLKGYFRQAEPRGVIEHERVRIRILAPGPVGRALLAPVFNLAWRPATQPVARWLYGRAMRSEMLAACAGSDVVHYLGGGLEMLGFSALECARRVNAVFCVDPAIHVGEWGDFGIDGRLYRQADTTFCYSRVEEDALLRLGVAGERIRRVPCGFDFDERGDAERFRSTHGLRRFVLFLGRKTPAKGVLRLAEAWPAVARRFPDVALVIAGPGPGKSPALADVTARTTARAGGGVVLDLDDLTDEEKRDALTACDVLCVPSTGESFGMVYYEAWAHRKPVVALDLPALRETIAAHDAGLLTANEPTAIAAALAALLSDSQRGRRMGENGYRLACRHRWEDVVVPYLDTYVRAAAAKRSPPA